MQPIISLIMPTKNRAKLIVQSIQTILEQTFGDWELIVVDDHGTDNTKEVIAKFNDDRIRVIDLTDGTGPASGRRAGIAEAKTDLLAFCDSDDLNAPDRLQQTLTAFEQNPDIDVAYGDITVFNTETNERYSRPSHPFDIELLRRINFIPTPTVAMKKSAYAKTQGFDAELRTSEDYDLWLQLAEAGCHFHYINQPLVTMRVHGENITKSVDYGDRRGNLLTVRQRHQLPTPEQESTLQLIKNPALREIFASEGAKKFWFSEIN